MAETSPDKLRHAVEESRKQEEITTPSLPRRRQLVLDLCAELSAQGRLDVQSDGWAELRSAMDPTPAVERYLQRLETCGTRDDEAYGSNERLGGTVSKVVELSSLLAAWPRGLEALAEHQVVELATLVRGDQGLETQAGVLRPSSGDRFSQDELCGLCALLYLRPTLTRVDLDRVKLAPLGLATLSAVLPASITSLSLARTDCASKGADLSGMRALCQMLSSGGSSLTALDMRTNQLLDSSADLLVGVCAANQLTSLDISGNRFGTASLAALSEAVRASSQLAHFGGVPLARLRADEQGSSLDLSDHQVGLLEALVLSELLPSAASLETLLLEGTPLPLARLRGASSSGAAAATAAPDNDGDADDDDETGGAKAAELAAFAAVALTHAKLADPSAVVIGRALRGNARLTSLDLSYNSLKAEGVTWLAQSLPTAAALASLSLAWNRLGVDGLCALAAAIGQCGALTALNLDNNALCGVNDFGQGSYSAQGLLALGDALMTSTQLTSLSLGNNALGGRNQRGVGPPASHGIDALKAALPFSGVTALTLDGNYLGSDGASSLLDALKTRPTLTSLWMADTCLADGGAHPGALRAVETLGAMLQGNRLAVLSLDGNRLGPLGAGVLAGALEGATPGGLLLSDLHLDREGNDLDEASEARLSKAVARHAQACLHLARSVPEHERAQQRVDLSVQDYIRRSAADSPLSTALSISAGTPLKERLAVMTASPGGLRDPFVGGTPSTSSALAKKSPLAASPPTKPPSKKPQTPSPRSRHGS